VGGLAHELRNPLSTVMVNLKLLAEDLQDLSVNPEDARRRGLLKVDVLRREAERLQQLLDEFLRLAGPCPLRLATIDLHEVIGRLVTFLGPLMTSRQVRVLVERDTTPLHCDADESLLSRALLNITLNAEQSMSNGGTLRIRLKPDGDDAVIEIQDEGVGISHSDRDRIFRPFYSTRPGGTGLGLPITKRIIEEHGGTLTFESEPGKGTTFFVRLPGANDSLCRTNSND